MRGLFAASFVFALAAVACTVDVAPENGVQGCALGPDPCASGFYCAADAKCWREGSAPGQSGDGGTTPSDASLAADAPATDTPASGSDGGPPGDAPSRVDGPLPPEQCLTSRDLAKIGTPCAVGMGACAAMGVWQCVGAPPAVACSAMAGTGVAEVCNGKDDDCNGMTDDGLTAPACDLTAGVCAGSKKKCGGADGWKACGQAEYGQLYQAMESACDGQDNDCNGTSDEGYPDLMTMCSAGIGECARPGKMVCNGMGNATLCNALAGAKTNEICNGKDDDCDNKPDNGFACPMGSGDVMCSMCGFDGLQTCSSNCSYAACSRFQFADVVYDDNWSPFQHQCGVNCQGDICATEGNTPTACFLIAGGPDLTLPPGKYELTWYVVDSGVFDFEVIVNGQTVSFLPGVNTGNLVTPYVVQTFNVNGCGQMNLRLRAEAMSRIRLYSITLKRTGDG